MVLMGQKSGFGGKRGNKNCLFHFSDTAAFSCGDRLSILEDAAHKTQKSGFA